MCAPQPHIPEPHVGMPCAKTQRQTGRGGEEDNLYNTMKKPRRRSSTALAEKVQVKKGSLWTRVHTEYRHLNIMQDGPVKSGCLTPSGKVLGSDLEWSSLLVGISELNPSP